MKKLLFILASTLLMLSGCTGVKTATKGLENQSFIEFVSEPAVYMGGVDVNIDDNKTFRADVITSKTKRPKGTVYAISPGKHTITVTYNKAIIYKKQIFVSSQETKTIILP